MEIFIERARRAERPLQGTACGLHLRTFLFIVIVLRARERVERSGTSSLAFAARRMWGMECNEMERSGRNGAKRSVVE